MLVRVDTMQFSPAALRKAVEILGSGGVIAHATETCYGLACDMSNRAALEKLFAIKHRPLTQPVSALFPSVADARAYVVWNDEAERLAEAHLPGPLTLIVPISDDAPTPLLPTPEGGATVGVRVSSLALARDLVAAFGRPVSTTSANIHGEPNFYSASAIMERFTSEEFQPDLVIDSGELPQVPSSTVMDLTQNAPTVRRQGDIGK